MSQYGSVLLEPPIFNFTITICGSFESQKLQRCQYTNTGCIIDTEGVRTPTTNEEMLHNHINSQPTAVPQHNRMAVHNIIMHQRWDEMAMLVCLND